MLVKFGFKLILTSSKKAELPEFKLAFHQLGYKMFSYLDCRWECWNSLFCNQRCPLLSAAGMIFYLYTCCCLYLVEMPAPVRLPIGKRLLFFHWIQDALCLNGEERRGEWCHGYHLFQSDNALYSLENKIQDICWIVEIQKQVTPCVHCTEASGFSSTWKRTALTACSPDWWCKFHISQRPSRCDTWIIVYNQAGPI